MSINYRHCYKLLELDSNADWEALRKNYKHLVQQSHPDRFEQHPRAKEKAESYLRELNHAYKALTDYYKEHQRLPFGKAPAKNHENWQFQNTAGLESRDEQVGIDSGKSRLAMTISKWVVVGSPVGMAIAVLGILIGQFNEGGAEIETLSPEQASLDDISGKSLKKQKISNTFHYGDSKKHVLEIQGKPDRIVGETWFYGKSSVDFLNGHVSHWEFVDGYPLHVSGNFPGIKRRFFGAGSSKEEVLSIQGEPIMKTRRRWDYGASHIEFEGDRVVGWYSSVLRPLAVREKEKKR